MQPSGVDSGIHPTPGTSPGEHINWPKASKSRHLNELRWWLEEYGIPELFDPLHEQLGVWTVDLLCDLSVNEANELEKCLDDAGHSLKDKEALSNLIRAAALGIKTPPGGRSATMFRPAAAKPPQPDGSSDHALSSSLKYQVLQQQQQKLVLKKEQ